MLWDRDTLGSPTSCAASPRSVSEREPRTWDLVLDGTYALGTVDSYLIARMTRGLEHVTDLPQAMATGLLDDGTWSSEHCAAAGVPLDALPEIVPSGRELGTTDPATFLGLRLPILTAPRSA
ncbi:hypothetical protein ISG29_02685 [Nocardioides sp. CBS4Y-1]|uniref:Carbohydrate kinase FGGY N-terminal domain-containing protein n=2 Tax=Nocardioides acrostichi TaxID=2784339 RepID=A0A930Y4U8_9ACTN|nr:hypothetical protein [Nocardioides acrostichi]